MKNYLNVNRDEHALIDAFTTAMLNAGFRTSDGTSAIVHTFVTETSVITDAKIGTDFVYTLTIEHGAFILECKNCNPSVPEQVQCTRLPLKPIYHPTNRCWDGMSVQHKTSKWYFALEEMYDYISEKDDVLTHVGYTLNIRWSYLSNGKREFVHFASMRLYNRNCSTFNSL